MSATKFPKEIEQQATYWYVRLRSTELTPEQESEFFAWLEASSLHQAAFIRVDQAWASGAVVKTLPRPKVFALNRGWTYWAGAAAVILLTFLLIYASPLKQKKPAPAPERYTTFSDQKIIRLPDQSSLVLRPNSDLEVRYSGSTRELHLHKGQIFLNVTLDVQRPFRVVTDQGTIRVIGTQFEVEQLKNDFKVTVVEGLVGLLKPDAKSADQTPVLVLSKNQKILYSDALKGAEATTVDAARETSWTKGRIIFDGTPLAEVTATLNRHLSLPIRIASHELETKRIVGVISVTDPRAAAASLASITGAVVEEAPNRDALILRSTTAEFSKE